MPDDRKRRFTTASGIEIQPEYQASDPPPGPAGEARETTGEYPFTRGVYPGMYRRRLWTMRQYAGFGDARESNLRYRYLLEQGQTGLSIAFDLPTQLGLDSDSPTARGEVGRVGVAVDTLQDMEILLDEIPLEKVSISMTINSTAAVLLAMVLVLAEKRGVSWDRLTGTIQNDILKEYIARGTYIFPPRPSLKIITDILAFCRERVPQWNTMSISGYHIREAGANAVQELSFTFANAAAYVEAARDAGLKVDDFAPRLSFFLAAHSDFFEEIAKFRAARRIWARLMRDRFGARDPRSWKFRFHTQTSGAALAAQEPDNNIVRVTLQALAAVLGGTQSLHTNSRDEALALPSRESARIALRTQQIIAHESGAADTADPLGGSYYVEHLTDEMEKRVFAYLKRIDDLGGMLRAIEGGFIQRDIQESAFSTQRRIETGEQVVVGLNAFQENAEEVRFQLHSPSPEIETRQISRLHDLRGRRNRKAVRDALAELKGTVERGDNLLPAILEAVRVFASLGEITDVLRDAYGTYTENLSF